MRKETLGIKVKFVDKDFKACCCFVMARLLFVLLGFEVHRRVLEYSKTSGSKAHSSTLPCFFYILLFGQASLDKAAHIQAALAKWFPEQSEVVAKLFQAGCVVLPSPRFPLA